MQPRYAELDEDQQKSFVLKFYISSDNDAYRMIANQSTDDLYAMFITLREYEQETPVRLAKLSMILEKIELDTLNLIMTLCKKYDDNSTEEEKTLGRIYNTINNYFVVTALQKTSLYQLLTSIQADATTAITRLYQAQKSFLQDNTNKADFFQDERRKLLLAIGKKKDEDYNPYVLFQRLTPFKNELDSQLKKCQCPRATRYSRT